MLTFIPGLNNYVEPCYLVYEIESPGVNEAVRNLRSCLPTVEGDSEMVERCRDQRLERVHLWHNANNLTVRPGPSSFATEHSSACKVVVGIRHSQR